MIISGAHYIRVGLKLTDTRGSQQLLLYESAYR
jgi:hypothetical protein